MKPLWEKLGNIKEAKLVNREAQILRILEIELGRNEAEIVYLNEVRERDICYFEDLEEDYKSEEAREMLEYTIEQHRRDMLDAMKTCWGHYYV